MSDKASGLEITTEFSKRTHERHKLTYPNEFVVRCLSQYPPTSISEDVPEGFDLGFGSAQHIRTMMDFGFRANGVELLQGAVDEANERFAGNELLGELFVGDFRKLEGVLPPQDYLVAWGSLFLRPYPDMVADLSALLNLAKPGGRLCANFRSDRNWFAGLGEELSDNHFLLDQRAGDYSDALYTFLDEKGVRNLVEESGWELLNIELYELTKNNCGQRHSWYCVCLGKAEA